MNATDDPTIEQHQEARNDLHGGPPLAHVAETVRQLMPPDPLRLLQSAIDKGIDATALETLCALQERWQANRAAEAYNAALSRCQAALPAIVKDAENKSTRSRYATLESVNKAIVPVYTKEGLAISFTTAESNLPDHIRMIATVMHEAGHSKPFQVDIPLDGVGAKGNATQMNKPQATGSTYSYARRYLEYLIFNLTITNEDDDGQGADQLCNDEQIAHLRALLDEALQIGAVKEGGKRFYKWLEVETLDALPLRKLDLAIAELNRAIALKKKEEAKAVQ